MLTADLPLTFIAKASFMEPGLKLHDSFMLIQYRRSPDHPVVAPKFKSNGLASLGPWEISELVTATECPTRVFLLMLNGGMSVPFHHASLSQFIDQDTIQLELDMGNVPPECDEDPLIGNKPLTVTLTLKLILRIG